MTIIIIIIFATFFLFILRGLKHAKSNDKNKLDCWESKPTLDEYLKKNWACKTETGIKCVKCNGKSIKNWGLFSAEDSKRLFICNSCGTELYRNN